MYCSHCGIQSLRDSSRFCHVCGAPLEQAPTAPAQAHVPGTLFGAPPAPAAPSRSGRYIALAVALLVLIIAGSVGGVFAYRSYQAEVARRERAETSRAKLEEAMGRDAGLTETILKVESESKSMTFKELFDLCDKSVQDRTALIVELRGLSPEMDAQLRDSLVEFLNQENELVRAKRQLYSKQLELSSKVEVYSKVYGDADYTSDYLADYYADKRREFKSEVRELLASLDSSATTFMSSYSKLAEDEVALGERLKARGIRFKAIFGEYREPNLKLASDSKESAAKIRKTLG